MAKLEVGQSPRRHPFFGNEEQQEDVGIRWFSLTPTCHKKDGNTDL